MLKENSECAVCAKRSDCLRTQLNLLSREKSPLSAIFGLYEAADCRMGILPFLSEKLDEQITLAGEAERGELIRISMFVTRLNALDTLAREAAEENGLSSPKQKIGADLLLGLLEEHRDIGEAVISYFLLQENRPFDIRAS